MKNMRTIVSLCIRGAVAGGLLGFVMPAAEVSAACRCDDGAVSSYQCNAGQTACNAGHEVCLLVCS